MTWYDDALAYGRDRRPVGFGVRCQAADFARAAYAPYYMTGATRHLAKFPVVPQAALPDTAKMSEAEKFDLYAAYIHQFGSTGAKQHLLEGKRCLLGLRIATTTLAEQGKGKYDDRMVVVWRSAPAPEPKKPGAPKLPESPGAIGAKAALAAAHIDLTVKNAREFNNFSTDPTAVYDSHFKNRTKENKAKTAWFSANGSKVDADGDGVYDTGRLGAGCYEMIPAMHGETGKEYKAFRPSPETVKAHQGKGSIERDINGDGIFEAHESRTDLDRSFKIHQGGKNSTGSAGCQIIRSDDYPLFLKTARRDHQQTWWYTLINVG